LALSTLEEGNILTETTNKPSPTPESSGQGTRTSKNSGRGESIQDKEKSCGKVDSGLPSFARKEEACGRWYAKREEATEGG